jgi:hypothetical protein
VVFLVSLEIVDVEHGVFPGEACRLERVLDRVSLGTVRGDDLEVFALLDVLLGYTDCGLNFALALNRARIFSLSDGFVFGESLAYPTNTLLGLPSVAHANEATAGSSRILRSVWSFEE